MSRSIDFPPLRNGVDYLQDAVHRLGATPSPKDLKYAVLHLHAGVEVLLKYRLICEDWRLILEDTDNGSAEVTEEDYEAGRFRSIGIGKALKRLQDLDGIRFTSGQKNAAATLDKFRNQLQHHGMTSTAEAVEAQAAKALGFILDFIDTHITPETHLTDDDEHFLADAMRDIRGALGTVTALVNQRMQRLRPVLAQVWSAWCPDCGQLTVLLESQHTDRAHGPEDDQPHCVFCTARWDSRKDYVDDFTSMRLGLTYYQAAQDGADPPAESCPECGQDMLVWYDLDTGYLGPKPYGRCFFCESEFNDRCPRCNAAVHNPYDDESMICYDCSEDLGHED
jgi:DNA-directed RNA polymerase subunit M/transcription elongation factor TFIIS